MKKNLAKKLLPHIVAAISFIVLSAIYCKPVFSGKTLNSFDTKQWFCSSQELIDYKNETGNVSFWTGSMFCGMPAYQINGGHPSNGFSKTVDYLWGKFQTLSSLTVTKEPISVLILYMLSFYIMMLSFGLGAWTSLVASIALSFSSYFFIIIPAGHMTKATTLATMAPVVGGFFLIFRRKKRLLGSVLILVFSALGIVKHPQMSYYLIMMMFVFGLAEVYIHVKEKQLKELFISLAFFTSAIIGGIASNFSNIASNAEYVSETIRGGHSDLVSENDGETAEYEGLDLEYTTAWSYGIGETMTFLIPNYMGGSSKYDIGIDSEPCRNMIRHKVDKKSIAEFASNYPSYWGEKSITSGPVYIGAIVCFLFILALCIVPGPYKWALLVSTLLSVMLAWGKNMMWLTELFYNYFPFYNKFRAVESILVVAQFAIPILAFLGVNQLCKGDFDKKKVLKGTYIAAGITGGLCLFFGIFGTSFLSFTSSFDAEHLSKMPDWFISDLINERKSLLKADCFRSFVFIALAFIILLIFVKGKMKKGVFLGILGVLIIVDMWPVNKRYFNDNNFVTPENYGDYYKILPYEKQLLQDTTYFRVFNTTTNVFNEARTSLYLKSIGGYHAAKLKRYQDLIDNHLFENNMNVFNMLNTKYYIMNDDQGNVAPFYNPDALGNAWFIDNISVVQNANEESDALNYINPAVEAVTDVSFSSFVINSQTEPDSTASIELLSYTPDVLEYVSHSSVDKTAVFSEIYYPKGWKAYIDGNPVDHFRVDYILRAMNIPAGDHTIRFEFRPDSIYKGYLVDMFFRILIMALSVGCAVWYFIKNTKKKEQ